MPMISRPYRYLADHPAVYRFMIEIYEKDWRNGVPAPFLEYALCSTWMDHRYLHRNRLWFDGETLAAFAFTEGDPRETYFSLRPGYEALIPEMLTYSQDHMLHEEGKARLVLFSGQKALIEEAKMRGYALFDTHTDLLYDFEREPELNRPLPPGFCFEAPGKLDMKKTLVCYWKGFDHEREEGPWTEDRLDDGLLLQTAPHFTGQYPVAVMNEQGDYVCCAGMWWTPENHLAYMEPLATVPECRGKGLAAAALSELYRRMKPLGATHMTGGAGAFYAALGVYKPMIHWTKWEKTIE